MIMLWITTLCVACVVILYVYLSYRRLKWNDTKAILQEIHERYATVHASKDSTATKFGSINHAVQSSMRRLDLDVVSIHSMDSLDFACLYTIFETYPDIHYIVWTPNAHVDISLVEQSRDTFLTFCYDPDTNLFLKNFGLFQRSQFTLEFLYYLADQKHPLQTWVDVMNRIGFTAYTMSFHQPSISSSGSPWYTYFFTIHFGSVPPSQRTYNGSYFLQDRDNGLAHGPRPLIFQTWIDHSIDNEYLWKCYSKTREVYADHPYKLFSDFEMKRFVRENYPDDVVRQYDNIIPSAFKSDFFRYLFLYKAGGLYMDISVMPVTNMFDYLEQTGHTDITFLSATDNGHRTRLWNGLMYATPGHPFMKYCIDQIMRLRKSTFKHCLYYTGPALLGEAVLVLGKTYPSYKLLRFLDGYPISDPSTNVALFSPKSVNGWKSHKRITKDMYRESSKSHYSMHCLYNQILYY